MKTFIEWLAEQDLLEESKRKKKWLKKVETSWEPPEGLFTKSAQVIASTVCDSSKSLKQAISRIIFYKNRAGKNLNDEDIARLDKAVELCHAHFEPVKPTKQN